MAEISKNKPERPRALRLNAAEFIAKTGYLTDEQAGKFIRLLCYQHYYGYVSEEAMQYFNKNKDPEILSFFTKSGKVYYSKLIKL